MNITQKWLVLAAIWYAIVGSIFYTVVAAPLFKPLAQEAGNNSSAVLALGILSIWVFIVATAFLGLIGQSLVSRRPA